jgi:hypothetical protein
MCYILTPLIFKMPKNGIGVMGADVLRALSSNLGVDTVRKMLADIESAERLPVRKDLKDVMDNAGIMKGLAGQHREALGAWAKYGIDTGGAPSLVKTNSRITPKKLGAINELADPLLCCIPPLDVTTLLNIVNARCGYNGMSKEIDVQSSVREKHFGASLPDPKKWKMFFVDGSSSVAKYPRLPSMSDVDYVKYLVAQMRFKGLVALSGIREFLALVVRSSVLERRLEAGQTGSSDLILNAPGVLKSGDPIDVGSWNADDKTYWLERNSMLPEDVHVRGSLQLI